ncbi:hypothetical protein HPB52_006301 [Rhipicephalus sanguineus]|uniref:Uncharacterized protein n=1 Tax=Rhipicephalus sanguineus TaxID=34632 RepID=A0A9D4PCR3_RHISA|nr:hypothetical protein HPB52_006301 [Rhipicephalus sanguineus]
MAYSVVNDVLLLETLSCAEIDDMLVLQCAPVLRRNLLERGLLDLDAMDSDVFHRLFRFRKMDLPDLLSSLLIPEEFVSAQRVRVPGNEALCMTLRRLSYPNRLCELELLFNRHSSVISSVVSTVLAHMEYHFNHLLADLTKHRWLNLIALENFSEAVEWGFGKVASEFAFVDFHKNQKMSRQRIGRMYRMATLLANCHTCLYGSLVCDYFGVDPPSLDEYLMPFST